MICWYWKAQGDLFYRMKRIAQIRIIVIHDYRYRPWMFSQKVHRPITLPEVRQLKERTQCCFPSVFASEDCSFRPTRRLKAPLLAKDSHDCAVVLPKYNFFTFYVASPEFGYVPRINYHFIFGPYPDLFCISNYPIHSKSPNNHRSLFCFFHLSVNSSLLCWVQNHDTSTLHHQPC